MPDVMRETFSGDGYNWQPHSTENGHEWMALYSDGIMRAIKCKRCNGTPLDYLTRDLKVSRCPTPDEGERDA